MRSYLGNSALKLMHMKLLSPYLTKEQGQPCKRGEAAARTGCIPKSKKPATSKPEKKPDKERVEPKPKKEPKPKAEVKPKKVKVTVEQAVNLVHSSGADNASKVMDTLMSMSVKELTELSTKLNMKTSGKKSDRAQRIVNERMGGKETPEEPNEKPKKEDAKTEAQKIAEEAIKKNTKSLFAWALSKAGYQVGIDLTKKSAYENMFKEDAELIRDSIIAGKESMDKRSKSGKAPLDDNRIKKALGYLDQIIKGNVVQQASGVKEGLGGINDDIPDEGRPKLTIMEEAAVAGYTGDMYVGVNKVLRSGGKSSLKLDKVIEGLNSAFEKTKPFEKPVKVYRGLYLKGKALDSFVSKIEGHIGSGLPMVMKGFTSTATVPGWGGNVEIEIEAKYGLDVAPYGAYGTGEAELLMDQNCLYKVQSIDRKANGKVKVKIVQLNDRPIKKGQEDASFAQFSGQSGVKALSRNDLINKTKPAGPKDRRPERFVDSDESNLFFFSDFDQYEKYVEHFGVEEQIRKALMASIMEGVLKKG